MLSRNGVLTIACAALTLAEFAWMTRPARADQPVGQASHAGDAAVNGLSQAPIELRTFQTHSRLSFRLDQGVESEWKDVPGGFELLLKGMTLTDLGAPLGSEEEWARAQARRKDPRLAGLRFVETPSGLRISGRWKFPEGAQALAHPVMEKFDYREKDPSRLVVDFWAKSGETVAQLKAVQKKKSSSQEARRAQDSEKARAARRLASLKEREEGEDLIRFCRKPLSDATEVFVPFRPVHEKVDLSRWFPSTSPDANYIYLEPKTKGEDAQYVRLALDLFRQGKPALAIKTLDFFEREHADSPYRHEMRFLRASALSKLGHADEALRVLAQLMVDAQDAPVGLHAAMFLAVRNVEKSQSLQALENFLWLIQHHGSHRLAWVFHLGAAEALYALKQTDRAAKEYSWVMMNAPDRRAQSEGALRLGDLYLERQQYEQALASYFRALDRYREQAADFPTVHLNRAETLYWLGQPDRAVEAYTAFLADFPTHPAGWRATLRLGEILGRREGEQAQAQSRKFFFDTINRYPYSSGATLARLRLLPCGDHGGMKLEAALRFLSEEADKFDPRLEMFTERMRDLIALTRVRAMASLGSGEAAVDAALDEIRSPISTEVRGLIGDVAAKAFRHAILEKLARGERFEALAFYQAKFERIPRPKAGSPAGNPDYLLGLSRAAADLGLASVATQLNEKHSKEEKLREPTRETASLGARTGAAPQAAPELEDRLKAAERAYTEARALWTERSLGEAQLAHVRDLLARVPEESPFAYGREIILGRIEENGGRHALALAHAAKAQLLVPAGAASGKDPEEQARLNHWVASLQARIGDKSAALEAYRALEKFKSGAGRAVASDAPSRLSDAEALGVPAIPPASQLLMAQGELLAQLGRWSDAASTYKRAVDQNAGGNHALYEYARALSRSDDDDDREESGEAMRRLASSKTDDFWRKLARETLAGSNNTTKEGRP
jgi:tetratricopeptide (TPR) repeat protein